MSALMTFTSHIHGKNAKVSVYPDRIEWEQPGRVTLTRLATGGALTGGVRKGGSTEMIPVRAVTSVTTRKDGMRNSVVSLIASGNTIDTRVSHSEADQLKRTLLQLMAS
jgi:hypothetical protein